MPSKVIFLADRSSVRVRQVRVRLTAFEDGNLLHRKIIEQSASSQELERFLTTVLHSELDQCVIFGSKGDLQREVALMERDRSRNGE